jgi:hypothetical protein
VATRKAKVKVAPMSVRITSTYDGVYEHTLHTLNVNGKDVALGLKTADLEELRAVVCQVLEGD